jgi:hypothetical protein
MLYLSFDFLLSWLIFIKRLLQNVYNYLSLRKIKVKIYSVFPPRGSLAETTIASLHLLYSLLLNLRFLHFALSKHLYVSSKRPVRFKRVRFINNEVGQIGSKVEIFDTVKSDLLSPNSFELADLFNNVLFLRPTLLSVLFMILIK